MLVFLILTTSFFFLKTSEKFQLGDPGKYDYDRINVTFGALSIFNATFKKYCWASEDTVLGLRIHFLHVRRKQFLLITSEYQYSHLTDVSLLLLDSMMHL